MKNLEEKIEVSGDKERRRIGKGELVEMERKIKQLERERKERETRGEMKAQLQKMEKEWEEKLVLESRTIYSQKIVELERKIEM